MTARRSMQAALAVTASVIVTGVGVAAAEDGGAGTAVRATLGSPSLPRAAGVFVGTLSGRTLTWRLTFNGLTGPASAAHLHLGAPGRDAARLCAPCTTGAHGNAMLSAASARALRQAAGYVDVHTARNPNGELRGRVALGAVPTLQLPALADGATLALPAAIRYVVTGFRVGPGAGSIVVSTGAGPAVALRPGGAGVAYVPDDKLLTGRRDLTFTLTRADGTPLPNREARVTVFGVRVTGRR